MGWIREGAERHEGFVVGLVQRDGCLQGSKLYRELQYPTDDHERTVKVLQAGCECGWRSSYFYPTTVEPATWAPYSISASEYDEQRARELWGEHVGAVLWSRE